MPTRPRGADGIRVVLSLVGLTGLTGQRLDLDPQGQEDAAMETASCHSTRLPSLEQELMPVIMEERSGRLRSTL